MTLAESFCNDKDHKEDNSEEKSLNDRASSFLSKDFRVNSLKNKGNRTPPIIAVISALPNIQYSFLKTVNIRIYLVQ